jgi:tetratricopeptide (TPR) repeat protein
MTLNAAAYYSADAGLDLKNAEELSRQSVATLGKQLNAVKLEDFHRDTLELLNFAGAFWDTFGWIKFKQGDFTTAEKYLSAASDLTDESTIQLHLGRVEEALGHTEQAMRAYAAALAGSPVPGAGAAALRDSGSATGPRAFSPVEQEAREHLVVLAGSEQAMNVQLLEASGDRKRSRSVTIPFSEKADLGESFLAIVAPGPKIVATAVVPGAKGQSRLLARFDTKTPSETFPDSSVTTIPRVARIRCVSARAQCELEFLPNETAAQAFSEERSQ